jgi:hypothetical protein
MDKEKKKLYEKPSYKMEKIPTNINVQCKSQNIENSINNRIAGEKIINKMFDNIPKSVNSDQ